MAALARLEREAPAALQGRALDLACGSGRHALLLARRGLPTDAFDRDAAALARLAAQAAREGLALRVEARDLEAPGAGAALAAGAWSLVVVVNFLWRPLAPAIARAVRPGGALFYETFTREQARLGRPRRPDHLLEPGELPRLFAGLEPLSYEEGLREGPQAKATLLARRPTAG